jgi:adenylate cyclase
MSQTLIHPRLEVCYRLQQLLDARNAHPERQEEIDGIINRRFRVTCAVLVLDMAGFSVSVQKHGIIHHLALIRRMNVAAEQAIHQAGGRVVKFDADNCFAAFPRVRQAVQAAVQLNRELEVDNRHRLIRDRIEVSIGIGYGPILLGSEDLFGDEVNLASKLGEDLAGHGEILLTQEAKRQCKGKGKSFALVPVRFSVGKASLSAYRLQLLSSGP